jgi:hypothetical protein
MENHYGMKAIDASNWLAPDPTVSGLAEVGQDGQFRVLTGEDWVNVITRPQLASAVPEDIRKLFEVARGCLVYGYYFYPLYTLGQEQLLRIVETAVMQKCELLGVRSRIRTFQNGVDYLIKQGVIDRSERNVWNAMVKLRNDGAHPSEQMILPPGLAIAALKNISDDINKLFL